MTYKLIFVGFWLAVGGGIFWAERAYGEVRWQIPLGATTHISTGWVALLFALYNFVGWWNYRMARARERAETTWEQKRYARDRRKHPEEGTNPDFDFKNPPPSAG